MKIVNARLVFLGLIGNISMGLFAQPLAGFKASINKGCTPLRVDFINNSTGAVKYQWTFGNSNSSNLTTPSTLYNQSGKYEVTLIAIDSTGNADTVVMPNYIEVFQSPQISISSSKRQLCLGDTVVFICEEKSGENALNIYHWDIGTGDILNHKNSRFVYKNAGIYDIALAVEDVYGCKSVKVESGYITVNENPDVSFSSDFASKCQAPAQIQFTSITTVKGILSYLWDFGDGSTSKSSNQKKEYAGNGDYDVSLKVTDQNGCKFTSKQADLIHLHPPKVDFTPSLKSTCANTNIEFTSHVFPSGGSYVWDFGDGSAFSLLENPFRTYSKSGKYSVKLTYIWDKCSTTFIYPSVITIVPAPKVNIIMHDTTVCRVYGQILRISAEVSNSQSLKWTDGRKYYPKVDTLKYFSFRTDSIASYKIKLVAQSFNGCEAGADSIRLIIEGPKADFSVSESSGCVPYNIVATSTGKGTVAIKEYLWESSQLGINMDSKKIKFTDNYFGNSFLFLTIKDANGCKDRAGIQLKGGKKFKAKFSIWKKEICNNEPLMVSNNSVCKNKDSLLVFWNWIGKDSIQFFGKDSGIIQFRVLPTLKQRITISNNSFGCVSQDTFYVKVNGPLLNGGATAFCEKDSITGFNQSSYATETWWQQNTRSNKKFVSYLRNIQLPLQNTKELWLFASNDNSKCKDSLKMNLDVDSQVAIFSYTLNCETHEISTINQYKGLQDSQFLWTFYNKGSKKTILLKQRNIEKLELPEGQYALTLAINNRHFNCTKSSTQFFTIINGRKQKARVLVSGTTCFPTTIQLIDNSWDQWESAKWTIDNGLDIPDSSSQIRYVYSGIKHQIEIKIMRRSDSNCVYLDSFEINTGGPDAEIRLYNQINTDCMHPVLAIGANVRNDTDSGKYTYKWDFGYRISYLKTDTIAFYTRENVKVQLSISDSKGCTSSVSRTFVAKAGRPKAVIRVLADTLISCPPLQISVADESQSPDFPIVKRIWAFGDNSTSEEINPSKIYGNPGTYSVSLMITNSTGCSDTQILHDLVQVKGPKGTLKMSSAGGCSPLEVKFGIISAKGIKKYTLDLGDGILVERADPIRVYSVRGFYVPRLIMEDSAGCKYSPVSTDTIKVYANPSVFLSSETVCADKSIVTAPVLSSFDQVNQISWQINGKNAGSGNSIKWVPLYPQVNKIAVTVSTIHGCKDSANAIYKSYGIFANLEVSKDEICLGSKIHFIDKSNADTFITIRNLVINSEIVSAKNGLQYTAKTKGVLPVFYEITDTLGCKDTFETSRFLKVGDTLAPPPLAIYSSSVLSDLETSTRFEKSKEPDFKDQQLFVYKNNLWMQVAITNVKTDTILIANGLQTNLRSYCHKISQRNFCGISTDSLRLIKHCTIETSAFGDTNASVLNWSPYIGWNKVVHYNIWRKEKDKNTFEIIGKTSGNNSHYIDSNFACHAEFVYKVEGVEFEGRHASSMGDSANAIPIHYMPVAAPIIWTSTVENNSFVHTEWLMQDTNYTPIISFGIYRNERGKLIKLAEIESSKSWLWDDFNTETGVENYTYLLQATDICMTKSEYSNAGRSVLLTVEAATNGGDAVLHWTPYYNWEAGIEKYKIERSFSDGPFKEIGTVSGDSLRFTDQNIPGSCIENLKYRVIAVSNQTEFDKKGKPAQSLSNQAGYTPEIKFFIPNAFTPDGNNLNEKFTPQGKYYAGFEMRIYNRWGQKVYNGTGCENMWDGRFQGELVPEGVFAYEITARDFGNKEFRFSGTITVLK